MREAWVRASVCGLFCAATLATLLAEPSAPAPLAAVAPQPASAPSQPAQAVGNPVPAVWKERHVDFFYQGRTVRYSCDGLRDKVRAMLLDLGARRDLKIAAVGCHDDRLPANSASPSLDIVFSAPALPDAAAKPQRAGDLAATDARFVAFTITSDAFRNMGIGDCELVQEFARQVLPHLATRNVAQHITCAPYRQNSSRFLVQGDILKTLPLSEAAVQRPVRAP